MRWLIAGLVVVALSVSMLKCGFEGIGYGQEHFLVVVEARLYEGLASHLDQYVDDLSQEQVEVFVEEWDGDSAEDLKMLLFEHVDRHRIEGALLVGEMPFVRYKQEGHIGDELGFPTDIFFQDRDAQWVDTDNDGAYDHHTPLRLDIYTSRLNGTLDELRRYFDRAHRYRHEGSLVRRSALVFIDNDWCEADTSDNLYLDKLYDDIEIVQDPTESSLDTYLSKLSAESAEGAEFVFQKVHAGPRIMNFEDVDEKGEPVNHLLLPAQVVKHNLKASFLNMTNCSAADFSTYDQSLGEAYTVGTDYGLAIIGSTKVGHLAHPDRFHRNLGAGMRWGEAYREWYNAEGVDSDKWHIGIVLMGDPLLKVPGSANAAGAE